MISLKFQVNFRGEKFQEIRCGMNQKTIPLIATELIGKALCYIHVRLPMMLEGNERYFSQLDSSGNPNYLNEPTLDRLITVGADAFIGAILRKIHFIDLIDKISTLEQDFLGDFTAQRRAKEISDQLNNTVMKMFSAFDEDDRAEFVQLACLVALQLKNNKPITSNETMVIDFEDIAKASKICDETLLKIIWGMCHLTGDDDDAPFHHRVIH